MTSYHWGLVWAVVGLICAAIHGFNPSRITELCLWLACFFFVRGKTNK